MTTVGVLAAYDWGTNPQMVADVQGWVADPTTNFGWEILGNELASQSAVRFASMDNASAALRPVLRVAFELPPTCLVFSATLAPEKPSITTTATGSGIFFMNLMNNTLRYNIVYTGLTSIETNAHFHGPASPGGTAGVIAGQPLTPNGSSPKSGVWNYSAAAGSMLKDGLVYVNIHTQQFPSGEIRGHLSNPQMCRQVNLPLVAR